MTMRIATLSNDGKGGTQFGEENVEFHEGQSEDVSTALKRSASQPCKRYFFSELPPGFSSINGFSSRRQICVLLYGELELTSSVGEVKTFAAGDTIRLEDTDYETPGRVLRVKGDHPAQVLAVQLD